MDGELQLKAQLDYRGRPRDKYQTMNTDPSETIQSDAHKADIKTILKKHGVTGIVEHLAQTDAQYVDVTELSDYAEVMRVTRDAEGQFMKLPPEVRELFDHDVAKWLDAAHDQEKRDAVAEAVNQQSVETATPGNTGGDTGGDTTEATPS